MDNLLEASKVRLKQLEQTQGISYEARVRLLVETCQKRTCAIFTGDYELYGICLRQSTFDDKVRPIVASKCAEIEQRVSLGIQSGTLEVSAPVSNALVPYIHSQPIQSAKPPQQTITTSRTLYAPSESKIQEFVAFTKAEEQLRQKREERRIQQEKKRLEIEEKANKQREEKLRNEEAKKRQQIQKQLQEKMQLREQQKQLRERYNQEFKEVKKKLAENPPRFREMETRYHSRHEEDEQERADRLKHDRKSIVDLDQIKKHVDNYDEMKRLKEEERHKKFAQMAAMQKALASKTKEHVLIRGKHSQSFSVQAFRDEKEELKQIGKQKQEKMKSYFEQIRRSNAPTVDPAKRQQLIDLIEQSRRLPLRKKVDEQGNIQYVEVIRGDHKMVGLEYLERAKEMALQSRSRAESEKELPLVQNDQKKLPNYLEELRKQPRRRVSQTARATELVQSSSLSYDQKVSEIERMAHQLAEKTKQQEMKLKFGKFKTSEEILNCKDQIDQNYIDIVNMKLKLIEEQR